MTMTMLEELKVMEDTKAQNARHIRRMKVVNLYRQMVKNGEMEEARTLLMFLRFGRIRLGLCDSDNAVEQALERIGYRMHYNHSYTVATVYC